MNGHFRVSPNFALRLEEIYGFDAKELVIEQAVYDLHMEKLKGT